MFLPDCKYSLSDSRLLVVPMVVCERTIILLGTKP